MFSNPVKKFVNNLLGNKISQKIEILIAKAKEFGLPEKDINEALINLEYNEFGLAFDVIVEQLYENEIKIDQRFYDLAKEISEKMELDKSKYEFLKELI